MKELKIELDNQASWGGLFIEINFAESLTDDVLEEVKKVITDWVEDGMDGKYERDFGKGVIHYLGDFEFNEKENKLSVYVDMGSVAESALDELAERLKPYVNYINKIQGV